MGKAQEFSGTSLEDIARQEGIADFVRVYPPRPRQEALAFLSRASVLVSLPQDSVMSLPSKLFEYMQFSAWLLALAEPGSATDLLFRELDADVVAPQEVAMLTQVLRRCYERYVAGDLPTPKAQHSQFSRAAQATKLFDAIEKLAGAYDAAGAG